MIYEKKRRNKEMFYTDTSLSHFTFIIKIGQYLLHFCFIIIVFILLLFIIIIYYYWYNFQFCYGLLLLHC